MKRELNLKRQAPWTTYNSGICNVLSCLGNLDENLTLWVVTKSLICEISFAL